MLRRLAKIFAIAMVFLLAVAIALVAFRASLAEAIITSRLAASGVANPRLSVGAFDLDHLEIADVTLGAGDELSAGTVTFSYSRDGLLAGRLDEVRVDGLRLRLDGSSRARPFGSLQPLISADGGASPEAGGGAIAPIPETVVLSNGRVELSLPEGPVSTEISGRWHPLENRASMTMSRLELPHVALRTAELQLEATGSRLAATGKVESVDDALDLDMAVSVNAWRDEPELDLALNLRLRSEAWRIPLWPQDAAAEGAITLKLDGRLPPLSGMFRETSVVQALNGAELHGRLRASVTDAGYAGRVDGISGTLDLEADAAQGAIDLKLADEGRLQIARLDPAWLQSLGVPPALRPLLEAGATLVLPSGKDALRASLRPSGAGTDLSLAGAARVAASGTTLDLRGDGSLALDESNRPASFSFPELGLQLGEVEIAGQRVRKLDFAGEISGPFDDLTGSGDIAAALRAIRIEDTRLGNSTVEISTAFEWAGERLELRQTGEGSASLASVHVGKTARIARPVSFRLSDCSLTLDATREGIFLLHSATMNPNPTTVELLRPDAPAVIVKLDGGSFRLAGGMTPTSPYRGKLDVIGGRLAVPESALAASDVSASVAVPMPSSGRFADVAVGQLSHTRTPAYFAPLRISGGVDRQQDSLILKATGYDAKGQERLSMQGRHRLAKGDGNLSLQLAEIAFRKGGPQPADLFPVLAPVREAGGRLGASAEIKWGAGRLESGGAIDLAGLAFTTDAARVEGLDGRVVLDSLFPLSTPPGQELTARRIDPGVPLEDIAARFDIEPATPPRLHLTEAGARFAEGRLTIFETVLDPAQERNDIVVGVEGADLSALLGLLKVEDVSGSGKLNGTIPIRIVNGNVVVADGLLEGEGPGILQVRSEAATSALAGAGEQVVLMLSALEDFRYDSLSVTLDMPDGETISVMARMQGHNPAVLEGYPFAFNINLSGNFTQLIAAIRQGANLSSDLIRPQMR